MKLLIAFDDTDNLTSPGTGHILEDFRTLSSERGWGPSKRISRHQLFVHPDVPYTSHNSAMCFELEIEEDHPDLVDQIEKEAVRFLQERSAEGSDPGLCILEYHKLSNKDEFISFGQRAKGEVLSKSEAYGLAERCGIRLSEHGGTGDGIIGALAGTALRLQGMDGRFRGQLEGLEEGRAYDSKELLNHPGIDRIAILEPGAVLDHLQYHDPSESQLSVRLIDKPKTILYQGESLFLLSREETEELSNWTRTQLKRF
ncbi:MULTISPECIES: hypothetical protein [unclassified Oceanispirochaeta]|uniref:hypothetical protein n=1 Tax=unclassified Oceanispirochaeta TaxID=2635722 RepID=UPI000E08DE41|nr:MULTISPECIES: hypothetical protein [unclassified Oceanispirochaeta]MBF9014149.1 hypothetical protein [Oceanispirochaeta sp. M2]NPD70639.1 hypothetical protein [Oceanispirochaeta sp. M1]RDG34402.1 hypothetical protein DV872_00885 [Oceanispirochaeta sp. M1]